MIKTIRFGRVKNIGNYQSERVEAEVEVTTTPEAAFHEAQTFVLGKLGYLPSNKEVEKAKTTLRLAGWNI